MEKQRTYNTTFKMEDKVGVFTLNDFKIYNKAMVIKTIGHWHTVRQKNKWRTADNLETDPCIIVNLERSLNTLQYKQLNKWGFFNYGPSLCGKAHRGKRLRGTFTLRQKRAVYSTAHTSKTYNVGVGVSVCFKGLGGIHQVTLGIGCKGQRGHIYVSFNDFCYF